jgi:hypothetical protein
VTDGACPHAFAESGCVFAARHFGEHRNTRGEYWTDPMTDPPTAEAVDHPAHYTAHPSGIECIAIAEHFNFNVGNAIKYLWRAGRKSRTATLVDLEKARWYVNREIERLHAGKGAGA